MRGRHPLRKLYSSLSSHRHYISDYRSSKTSLDEQIPLGSYPSKKDLRRKLKQSKNCLQPAIDKETIRLNMHVTNLMRNGQCEVALDVFDSIPRRSTSSYNAMISGYLSNGKFDLARQLFDKMPERDLFTWNVMLGGFVRYKNLAAARELFEKMPERDIVSWNTMLSGYAKNGHVAEARGVFDRMPIKNSVSWNGLLATYVQNGMIEDANDLFESKMNWHIVSWNCLIGGFVKKNRLDDARRLFDRIPVKDEVSWNTIISGYAKNGELEEARRLFEECPTRDVFTWTALVSGYVQHEKVDEARSIFDRMPEKNTVAWNAMVSGYAQSRRMDMAKELFEAMPTRNISSWNTMITGYSQTGHVADARRLFDVMPMRDPISWSAMIAGYVHNNCFEEALSLLVVMRRVGERLIRPSFACALTACARIADLGLGRQLHGWLFKVALQSGCYVGNALISMYYKCGSIDEAHHAFEEITNKDVISWNSMIYGYARHGFGKEALAVFELMKKMDVKPDDVTMVGVLSACSHTGLLDKGTEYFYSMYQEYGIPAKPEHYTCMVDLLGRAGRLEEAHNLVRNMPFKEDAATWGALLSASRTHGNTELGRNAAEIVFKKEPNNTGMHVLLSNIFASSGRWNDVSEMRLKMRNQGVKKEPGCSWLEVQSKVHTFTVGDCLHPEKDKIYAYLEEMYLKMKHEGYSSSTKLVLQDVEEEEKEHMLKYHSEKLAVAYGVLSIPTWRPIRVIKNLRICEDCHNVIKYISKIEGRLIIIRDRNRFHHFEAGSCSCGDYW